MLRTAFTLFLAAVSAALLPGQVVDPGDAVGIGHLHLRVSEADYPAHRKALVDGLGLKPISFGRGEAFLAPGVVVLVQQGEVQGPSVGTTVDHIGFLVKDLAAAEAKFEAAGGKVYPDKPSATQRFVELPGGVKVELSENKSLDTPIANHHIHFFTPSDAETQAWYIEMFGAAAGTRGRFKTGNVIGGELTFAVAESPVVGTQGHSVDHIGFEVNNLEEFCKQLEAKGVKFDRPFRSVPQIGLNIAFLTDPWGGYIELTEGLSKLK